MSFGTGKHNKGQQKFRSGLHKFHLYGKPNLPPMARVLPKNAVHWITDVAAREITRISRHVTQQGSERVANYDQHNCLLFF